jgi:hypothetical protein
MVNFRILKRRKLMLNFIEKIIGMLMNEKGVIGNTGKHLKYGKNKGHSLIIGRPDTSGGLLWAASQVVGNQSGKFVYMNAGVVTLCLDAVAQIFGWASEYARTPASTDVVTGGIDIALDAIYRIPVNSGTFAAGMIGDLCDISISSNVQGAQLDASVENLLIICGGDLINNYWVDVKINPAIQGAAVGVEA